MGSTYGLEITEKFVTYICFVGTCTPVSVIYNTVWISKKSVKLVI